MNAVDRLGDGLPCNEMLFRAVLFLNRELARQNVAGVWHRMRVPLQRGMWRDRDFENRNLRLPHRIGLIRRAVPRGGALDKSFDLNRGRCVLYRSEAEEGRSKQSSSDHEFQVFSCMKLIASQRRGQASKRLCPPASSLKLVGVMPYCPIPE